MRPKLELVPHDLDSSIHAFFYENNHFDAPWHYHEEFELTYIRQSSGIRYVGSSIDNFQPGDLVLLGSSLPHTWKNDPTYSAGSASICIQWSPQIFEEFLDKIVEFQPIRLLLSRADHGLHFEESGQTAEIGKQLEALPQIEGARKIMAFMEVLLSLSQLKEVKALSGSGGKLLKTDESDHRVKDIVTFIEQNFTRKITIGEMSDLTFMTKVSFCKYFKKQFSKSFTHYLNEFRIRKVCQGLQDTDFSINQLAMECGYENMSFFHRQFKKFVGLTPATYRSKYHSL
ncbi:AraC family transcriptional regulator [Flammeovirgaceae bacterium SG7u.111]|nr:AraC family transcriptional regulator [Flammeovirgaceae bacterium SG7u.132]WPO37502.1 AraC family transcriptional regulator [Flammeovirgaceae bacterium SG7u.111]